MFLVLLKVIFFPTLNHALIMSTNTENTYELATPLTFGAAFGFFGTLLGPAGAVGGFVVGACLGFWFDKKQNNPVKSRDEAPLESSAKKSVCH